MAYTNYDEFNKAHSFEKKAGFQLTPLQKADAVTFLGYGRSLSSYEVGSGKTVVSTVVSLMSGSEHTVVTVPPILIPPWVEWLRKVSKDVLAYKGTPQWRTQQDLKAYRWIVVSHAIFRDDFAKIEHSFRGADLDLIVDEAQAIKNAGSVLFRKVSALSAGRNLQLLTGTPLSKPDDAYAYIKLKTPDMYRSYGHFENVHVEERDFFGKVTKWGNLEILKRNFEEKTISRSKEEVHGYVNTPLFPDTQYDLEPAHAKLYERLVEEQLLELDNGCKIDATTAQKLYHACQQIVVNYGHFAGDPTKRSKAFDVLDSTIEQTDCLNPKRSKLIVWTYYKLSSRTVLKYLLDKGIKAVAAYSEAKTEESVRLFMTDPDTRILVAQPTSVGAGLNPQHVCWEALFLETSTVPMHSRQAIGRIDRVGQKHKPSIRFAVARDTIQVQLLHRLLQNADLVSRVEGDIADLRSILLGRPAK